MLVSYCSNYQAFNVSAVRRESPLPQVASSGFCKKKRVAVPPGDVCADVMVHAGNYRGHLVPLCRGYYISAAAAAR